MLGKPPGNVLSTFGTWIGGVIVANQRIALVLCFMASLCYAAELVITDKKLGKVSPIVLTFFFGITIAICALPGVLHGIKTGSAVFPPWKSVMLVVAVGVLSFLADWCHFGALHYKAGGTVLATFYMLLPVFSSMMKGNVPSLRMIAAWVLGGAALYLISHELVE